MRVAPQLGHRQNRSMNGGGGGFDDSVPGDVTRTAPFGDETT